jgi:hypothetical protein
MSEPQVPRATYSDTYIRAVRMCVSVSSHARASSSDHLHLRRSSALAAHPKDRLGAFPPRKTVVAAAVAPAADARARSAGTRASSEASDWASPAQDRCMACLQLRAQCARLESTTTRAAVAVSSMPERPAQRRHLLRLPCQGHWAKGVRRTESPRPFRRAFRANRRSNCPYPPNHTFHVHTGSHANWHSDLLTSSTNRCQSP